MAKSEPTFEPLKRAARAGIVLLGHLGLASFLIVAIWLLDHLIRYLWAAQEPMLFAEIPLKWLFHAIDLGILLVFGFWGIVEANQKLKG